MSILYENYIETEFDCELSLDEVEETTVDVFDELDQHVAGTIEETPTTTSEVEASKPEPKNDDADDKPATEEAVEITDETVDEVKSAEESKAEKAKTTSSKTSNEVKMLDEAPFKPADVPTIDYDLFKPIIKLDGLNEEEISDAACNRAIQETYRGVGGMPVLAIWLYIYNRAKNDVDFAKLTLIKSKTLDKCINFLKSKCRGGMHHSEIFDFVEEYYTLDDKEIAEKEAERKAKAKANAAAKSKDKAKSAKTSKPKAKKKAEKPVEKPIESPQLSLLESLEGF